MLTIVFVVLAILLLLAVLPTWPYSAGWGYYPAGGFALLIVLLILAAVVGWI
jgi:hypothetical protein